MLGERFWSKVAENPETGCWEWTAARVHGYGVFHVAIDGERRLRKAHRLAYVEMVGAVPEALDLDHLCRVRHCVNPAHLEPVTRSVNLRRGSLGGPRAPRETCRRGHVFTPENTLTWAGARRCAACYRAADQVRRASTA